MILSELMEDDVLAGLSDSDNVERLRRSLARIGHIVGMGEPFPRAKGKAAPGPRSPRIR